MEGEENNGVDSEPWTSQVALVVKDPPAVQETQEMRVPSLGRGDPLEEGTAAHSSVLVWRTRGQRSLAAAAHGAAESRP